MNPAHYPNLQMYKNINLNSETFASAHSVGDFFFFVLKSVKKSRLFSFESEKQD